MRDYEPSEEILHIWFLHTLQRGGYPFQPNDLTVEEWVRLGVLKDEIELIRAGARRG